MTIPDENHDKNPDGNVLPLPEIELNPDNFTNRELSTIDFNRRILELAEDESIPLLERIKFLAIVGSNLDEFYMVRVASYVQKRRLGIHRARPDGYTPNQLLTEIRKRVIALMSRQRQILHDLLGRLETYGVFIRNITEIKPATREAVRAYFFEEVFPVLTPLASDHARPFPFISNLSMNIAVHLINEQERNGHMEFVRIKVPETLPRIVNLQRVMTKYAGYDDCQDTFLWIEDIIADNLDLLFPGMTIIEQHPFRVTRNADIDYEYEQEDEEMGDISAIIEAGVRGRRFGEVVRLTVQETISRSMLNRLIHELDVQEDRDVYIIPGALGSSSMFELMQVDHPELKYPPYVPRLPDFLQNGTNIFKEIAAHDVMVYHPYDSFGPVEEFFRAAARDPNVLAIKATLYRVGKNSPVVKALMEARENDKQVAVLVELKARFDEENNLEWARAMEEKGVHVIYGVEKLPVKTHAKVSMVVRKEGDGLRQYVHLGTGNYNASTARLYTDVGIFTANPEIAHDATRLFNRLTGYAPETDYKRLLVAPEHLHKNLVRLIDNEIEAAEAGKDARLIFKMNQLEEDVIIQRLYRASQAGVKVDLIVRGFSCLRAGLPGVSENIRLISICGRFLEHPRVFYFANAPEDQRLYAGSADLMRRNLYNRVEVVFPILDERLRERMLRMLGTDLRNNTNSWEMQPDGSYIRLSPPADQTIIDSQDIFMENGMGLPESDERR
ncbi:MAG: polyphosphate kinase 1 [Aggregatilineales bacterium]